MRITGIGWRWSHDTLLPIRMSIWQINGKSLGPKNRAHQWMPDKTASCIMWGHRIVECRGKRGMNFICSPCALKGLIHILYGYLATWVIFEEIAQSYNFFWHVLLERMRVCGGIWHMSDENLLWTAPFHVYFLI